VGERLEKPKRDRGGRASTEYTRTLAGEARFDSEKREEEGTEDDARTGTAAD
jgi:hypothetical protein